MDKLEFLLKLRDGEAKSGKTLAKVETAVHKLFGFCDDLDALVEALRVDASNTELDKAEALYVSASLGKMRKASEVLRKGLNHYEKL
jgi:hypothetical protein